MDHNAALIYALIINNLTKKPYLSKWVFEIYHNNMKQGMLKLRIKCKILSGPFCNPWLSQFSSIKNKIFI